MTASLLLWGVSVLLVGVLLWFCRPRISSLLIWAVFAIWLFYGSLMPLAEPAPWSPPPGKYTVLGARIDVDKAIYVLLDSNLGGSPRYYVLPYSTGRANQLQSALNASEGGSGGVEAEFGDGGELAFHAPPVQEDRPKQAEVPQFGVE